MAPGQILLQGISGTVLSSRAVLSSDGGGLSSGAVLSSDGGGLSSRAVLALMGRAS